MAMQVRRIQVRSIVPLPEQTHTTNNQTQEHVSTPKKEKNCFIELLRDFAENTTAHGFGQIAISKSKVVRIIWVAIIILFFVFLVFQIYPLVALYAVRPVLTKIQLINEKSTVFPVVVVCNENMIKKSMDKEFKAFVDLFDERHNQRIFVMPGDETDKEPIEMTGDGTDKKPIEMPGDETDEEPIKMSGDGTDKEPIEMSGDETDEEPIEMSGDGTDEEPIEMSGYGTFNNKSKYDKSLVTRSWTDEYLYSASDEFLLFNFGHQFKETVTECVWNGFINCDNTLYWEEFWDYQLGLCFAFNGGYVSENAADVLRISRTGPGSGLKMTININLDEYNFNLSSKTGVWLYIGDQGEMYTPYKNGFTLAPGFAYSLALKKKVINRADPFQNNSCGGKNFKTFWNDFGIGQNVISKYSRDLCMHDCLATKITDSCNCVGSIVPIEEPKGNSSKRCDDLKSQMCIDSVKKEWDTGTSKCLFKCNPSCHEVKYDFNVGTMRNHIKNKSNNILEEDDLLTVEIFYKDLGYENYVYYEHYKLENLLGDIGGQMGLLNGYSLLTVIEILILFFQSIGLICCLLCKKQFKLRL